MSPARTWRCRLRFSSQMRMPSRSARSSRSCIRGIENNQTSSVMTRRSATARCSYASPLTHTVDGVVCGPPAVAPDGLETAYAELVDAGGHGGAAAREVLVHGEPLHLDALAVELRMQVGGK